MANGHLKKVRNLYKTDKSNSWTCICNLSTCVVSLDWTKDIYTVERDMKIKERLRVCVLNNLGRWGCRVEP